METLKLQQEARAKLRESFVRALIDLNDTPCNIITYEKSALQATFQCLNMEGTEMLVHNLKTPTGSMVPSALLRTPDVLAVQFHEKSLLP